MPKIEEFCSRLYDYRLIIILSLGTIYIAIFWPGYLSPDSIAIFNEVHSGCFSDHNPPLFGYLWMYLIKIIPGSGLMFAVQAILIWATAYNLACVAGKKWPVILCILLPFYPCFVKHSLFIWKDVHFTHGYTLIASLLIKYRLKGKSFNNWPLLSIIFLLFYSTAVKYQARFLLPIFIFAIIGLQFSKLKLKYLILNSILVSSFFIFIVDKTNQLIVPYKQQSHAWECVKLYDLTGMSIFSKQILLPKFMIRDSENLLENLQEHYVFKWEPLVWYPHSPLRRPKDAQEREILRKVWFQAVLKHPYAYLKHRSRLSWCMMSGNSLLGGLLRYRARDICQQTFNSQLVDYIKWGTYIFSLIIWMPFLIFYIFYGWYKRKKYILGAPLTLISLSAVTLPAFLFVFSLAATPRYVYFSHVMLFIANILFLLLFLSNKKNNN